MATNKRAGFGETIVLCGALAAAAGVAIVTASDARGEIYRCSVEGRTVYSDRPCGNVAKRVDIESAPAPESQANLSREAALGRLAVGMTAAQVQQAWGRPAEIATERDGAGQTERWTYRRSSETTVVHFKTGQVAKLEKMQTLAPAAQAPPPVPRMPTLSELEEDERAMKADERRFLREGMTQAEVRGKLGPPQDRRVRAAWFGMADCWTYPPTSKDPQTRTDLCFSVSDTRLVSIERSIER